MDKCVWARDKDDDERLWETDCGQTFFMEEGTPKENDFKYCTFCGHEIEEAPYGAEDGRGRP